MDLIKKLGGYEKAKEFVNHVRENDDPYKVLAKYLLQYRRANNIFEVGDKVVFHNLPYARLFYVKAVLDDSIIVRECWDEAGARCFSEFKPYLDIRHANPEEIAAGHRL